MTNDIAEILASARDHALTAGTREASIDPDADARQYLRALGAIGPGPGTAEGLLAVLGAGVVVPIDRDTLAATGEAFTGFSDAAEHYRRRPQDGVGLALGRQPSGATLLAVHATAAAWAAWLAEHGTETREIVDDDGRVLAENRSYLHPGRHLRVHWSPRGVQARSTPVAVGRAAIHAEGEKIRTDRAGVGEVGWVAWAVAADHGLSLTFKDRQLEHGVAFLADGVLPMAATRADGWHLSYSGSPSATLEPAEVPPWLLEAFRGRGVKS